ncbi:hypothetical protein A2U01_0043133, partial [Trifolium medium]|nr:hypothetical protein [Trifolium medium]
GGKTQLPILRNTSDTSTFERRSELPLLLNFHRSPLDVIPDLGEDVNSDESLPHLLR